MTTGNYFLNLVSITDDFKTTYSSAIVSLTHIYKTHLRNSSNKIIYKRKNQNSESILPNGTFRQKGRLVEINKKQEKICKYCGSNIVWLESKSKKYYPVDMYGISAVYSANFHKCI